jgi:hypothetical protein
MVAYGRRVTVETNLMGKTINNMINQRLMDTHTSYLGKIISINFNLITVQPLSMYKIYGEKAKTSSLIKNIPALCPYKYVFKVDEETNELITIEQQKLETGDTVYCGVCERDITEAKKGNIATSSIGRHHNLSDSVVIIGLSKVEYVSGGD